MKRRTMGLWIAASAVILAVAAGVLAVRRRHRPQLPPEARYAALPAQFGVALAKARQAAVASGYAEDDVRALARLYQANRLNDEALACISVLRGEGSALTAKDHYYLADIYAYRGDLDAAEAELRATIAAEPGYLPARLMLGDALLKSGRPGESAKEYEAILARQANQPQAMFALARLDLQAGRDEAAMVRLGTLLAAHPDMTSGVALLAQICDRRGEAARAATLRQWSRQKPEPVPADPWMDELLGDSYDLQRLALKFEEYYSSGDISLAAPLLKRVEELDPRSPIPPLLRGWNAARNHDEATAVAEYREALDRGGDPEKICPYLAEAYLSLGRTADAARLMAEFSAKKPDSNPILVAYSQVALKEGDKALARTLLAKVTAKEPYLTTANMSLAGLLWESGDRDGAAACLERVVQVSPSDLASRALLGQYYLGKRKPGPAIPVLGQALGLAKEASPERANIAAMLYAAYVGDGAADEAAGKIDDALARFDQAALLAPANPAAYARMATLCARTGKFSGAAQALEKLAALQPGNPTIFLSLGDVRYQSGDRSRARTEWQKALDLTRDSDTALRGALRARLDGPVTEATFQ